MKRVFKKFNEPIQFRGKDFTSEKYAKLTILKYDHTVVYEKQSVDYYVCKCDCGNLTNVSLNNLRSARTQSCGCLKIDVNYKHGLASKKSYDSIYHAWLGILSRCYNSNNSEYLRYGGRGITVCERWKTSVEIFKLDMGPKPTSAHSIERINNDGHYCPENCKWATILEQASNRCSNHFITAKGKTQTIAAWTRELGYADSTITERIRRGRTPEEAIY